MRAGSVPLNPEPDLGGLRSSTKLSELSEAPLAGSPSIVQEGFQSAECLDTQYAVGTCGMQAGRASSFVLTTKVSDADYEGL